MANVPAAARALDILDVLTHQVEPVSAGAIAQQLDLPRSSVYHLLAVLRDRGYVTHLAEERRWGLGMAAHELGSAYQRQAPLQRVARPVVQRLSDRAAHNAHLAVLVDRDVLYLLEERAPGREHLVTDVGVRLPATLTATGLALLALLPRRQVQALFPDAGSLVQRAGLGPANPAQLHRVLEQTRARGHALEESLVSPGLSSVGIGVRDHSGHPLAAVALTYSSADVDASGQQRLVALVASAADAISRRIRGPR